MVRRTIAVILTLVPWAIALVAGGVTAEALLQQVGVERDLNAAMSGMLSNMHEATVLTRETAQALVPLRTTTQTLEQINARLKSTGDSVDAINGSMERVIVTQKHILTQVQTLNQRTGAMVGTLKAIGSTNQSILKVAGDTAGQTGNQAGLLDKLNAQTREAILSLATTNRRFGFLKGL